MAADETSGNENERANDAGNNYPPADANNRTFLITASLLTGTLLLLSLFTVGYLLFDRAGSRTGEIAAIETQNAQILATNDMRAHGKARQGRPLPGHAENYQSLAV